MTEYLSMPKQVAHAAHEDPYSKTIFGFWTYLMSDCVLFAILFATYAVLHTNTFGGPSGRELFDPFYVLGETLILLTSSFTCGLAVLAAHRNSKKQVIVWLIVTFILGLSFLGMEINEFSNLAEEGNSWTRSAFLSSFFTLVGTHGMHITVASVWMLVMLGLVVARGITSSTYRRLKCFSLFWHFLDLVWIFIFTLVYLMEVV